MILPNTPGTAWILPGLKYTSDIPGVKSKFVNRVINAVLEVFSLSYDDINKPGKRTYRQLKARAFICYILRKNTTMSLNEIAATLPNGLRDHSSVLYSIKRCKDFIQTGETVEEYQVLKNRFVL